MQEQGEPAGQAGAGQPPRRAGHVAPEREPRGAWGLGHLSPRRRRALAAALGVVVIAALALTLLDTQGWLGQHASATIATSALLHDSRDPLYRSPRGAVPTGQTITLRLRTAANNAGKVLLRTWDTAAAGGHGDVVWYTARRAFTRGAYDYWEVVIPPRSRPRTLWYKWLITAGRGTQQVWYEDHYDRVHGNCDQVGGPGQVFTLDLDCSYELNVYQAGFDVPDWVKHAVIYQIFVDRFFNGSTANDALVQPNRYDGSCDGPDGKPTTTGYYLHANWNDEPLTPPGNCDFFGGDLQGVIARLDYLHSLGVTALYLNPIFMADSNHKYDTTDYTMIDPHFGNLAIWQQLVQKAHALGMHLILDGVFNHTSSDSIYFDRYQTWHTGGAAATQASRYADWYQFSSWPGYSGWAGIDSLPQLTEQQDVRDFIFAGDSQFVQDANDTALRQRYGEQPLVASSGANSVATYWLAQGADGWRLDVAEGKSDDWWRAFRTAIKAMDPSAITIGEHWGDASEWLLGDQQDGTMNYRFRSAVLSFFDNGGIDPDPGHDNGIAYTASQFDAHLQAVLEEYPLPAVYASMNLLDSHDTGRILWELGDAPGATPDQIALAKQKLRLIVLFQMTWIGAPTIYYGDEAGQTQTTYLNSKVDPGDRRTFPWDHQDSSLEDWYREWIGVRAANPVLATGAETTLLTDDAQRVFAYQRRDKNNLAVVVLNADTPTTTASEHTVTLRLANVPDGTRFVDSNTDIVADNLVASHGKLVVPVMNGTGRVLVPQGGRVAAPTALAAPAPQTDAAAAAGVAPTQSLGPASAPTAGTVTVATLSFPGAPGRQARRPRPAAYSTVAFSSRAWLPLPAATGAGMRGTLGMGARASPGARG